MTTGGKKLHLTSAKHCYKVSARVTSGSTKLKSTLMETESVVTSALRFTCRHAELACCNISISLPVTSKTSHRLSLQVCPSCAVSMGGQVLESLESTCHPKPIGKSGSECLDWPTSFEGTM